MKSDLELAVESSKALESLLEKNYAATGRGLHQKLDSVADRLPSNVIRDARFIATIRNKIVHEATTQGIEDRARFTAVVQRLVKALSAEAACAKEFHRTRTPSAISSCLRLLRSKGWHQPIGAFVISFAVFFLSSHRGIGMPRCVLFAMISGLVGWFWNFILEWLIALLISVAAISLLSRLYFLFNP